MLTNEAYTGTLVWGQNARDGAPPVRVEDAFPSIVTRQEFDRITRMMQSRAPSVAHPRRAVSPYLLSGLLKCETCRKAMTAAEAKGGKYTYYICHSLLKQGSGACDTPRLNAKSFEDVIISNIRDNILTESNIRDLVKLVDEEMDGIAREQRQRLETIEAGVGRGQAPAGPYLAVRRDHRHRDGRRRRPHQGAQGATGAVGGRRPGSAGCAGRPAGMLDSADTIAAFTGEMSEFLKTSELTETRAFVRSFVKEVQARPGKATIIYTIPMPKDSPIGGTDAAEIALNGGVMNTVHSGGR